MKEIPLSQGMVALVDDGDYELVSQYRYRAAFHKAPYAERTYKDAEGKEHTRSMHRDILNPPPGLEVDHINHDGLDNRRCNLRTCTVAQNQANRVKASGCTSNFRGVSRASKGHRWQAAIKRDGRTRYLGTYDTEQQAAEVYNGAAKELFGEFARLNNTSMGAEEVTT